MSRQFTALQGFAILFVIINHAVGLGNTIPTEVGYPPPTGLVLLILMLFGELGAFAVPIFLFTSGSFFTYALSGKDFRTSVKIIKTNILHVLWPYLIWSIFFYLVVAVFENQENSILGYLKSLIVGYPYNFIPILIFFYVFSLVLVRYGKKWAWLMLGLISLYQLFSLNIEFTGILGFSFPHWATYLTLPVLRRTLAIWGIYFPLGVIYSLHRENIIPWLTKFKWVLILVTAILYFMDVLDAATIIHMPIAHYLLPVTFILLIPLLKRESIPYVRGLENFGRRSYGLYLTNLTFLYLILIGIRYLVPQLLNYHGFLELFVFCIASIVLINLLYLLEKSPRKFFYRHVFG
jgi:hypothetical protein